LAKLIEETIQHLSYMDIQRKIRTIITDSCNQTIRSDKNRITVILNNLLSNAYRYHNYNQSDPIIEFATEKKGDKIFITVRDNGYGIPDEHKQKIFDMFYRASEISEGSGLGLYIVKETLEKLGGSITVDSKIGEGSAFIFSIPSL